jgi:hydroxyacylglutathione hydrolase
MYPRVDIVPLLADNYCYFVHEREGRGVAIVDPGDAAGVVRALAGKPLRPLEIWLTHKHDDHIAGAAALARRYDVPVRGPVEIPDLKSRFLPLSDGAVFHFGPAEVQVRRVRGHTSEHLVYHVDGALFTGDALFIAGCGRLFEGTAAELHDDLQSVFTRFPDNSRVYCGHEYAEKNIRFALYIEPHNPDVLRQAARICGLARDGRPSVPGELGLERRTNPFLRAHVPEVIEGVKRRTELRSARPDEVFAALRRLRDGF